MTLHRRSLLPPTSLADIAISALSGQGQYGAVTQIANDNHISRQAVYRLRDEGQRALVDAFTAQPTPTWTPDVPEATLKRAIVAPYTIGPNSIDCRNSPTKSKRLVESVREKYEDTLRTE